MKWYPQEEGVAVVPGNVVSMARWFSTVSWIVSIVEGLILGKGFKPLLQVGSDPNILVSSGSVIFSLSAFLVSEGLHHRKRRLTTSLVSSIGKITLHCVQWNPSIKKTLWMKDSSRLRHLSSAPDPLWIRRYSHATTHLSPELPSVQWRQNWREAFLTTVKHSSLLWLTLTRGPSFLGSLPVGTLVSVSPGKRQWTKGRDPREGLNSLFRVDCYQGCWLCVHSHRLCGNVTINYERSIIYTFLILLWNGLLLADLIGSVCEDCEQLHHGDCPVHGPLAPLDESGDPDQESLAYTKIRVPSQLTIKPSSIPAAGLGVFAKSFIPRGVKMGPYVGEEIDKEDVTEDTVTSYMWEVCCFCSCWNMCACIKGKFLGKVAVFQ